LVILLGTVLFRSGSMAQAGQMLGAMFTGWRFTPEATLVLQQLGTGLNVFVFLVGLVGSMAVVPWLKKHTGTWGEPVSYVVSMALLVLCVLSMAGSGFQPFIYLQF
jgi:alginate O-acetyltransferase complex protein AlgI